MMHLSLITLPRNHHQWEFIRPYALHQILWKGFPGMDRNDGTKRNGEVDRFLFRHQEAEEQHSVLVQSPVEPDWAFLDNEATGVIARVKAVDPASITPGTRLRFLLRANPVVYRTYPDGKKRHIAVGSDRDRQAERLGKLKSELPSRETMLVEWLQRKGTDGGFDIVRGEHDRLLCDVGPNTDIIVRKPKGNEPPITLTTVDFSGVITVTDGERFQESIQRGIGRGRAFGCGLLSVARL